MSKDDPATPTPSSPTESTPLPPSNSSAGIAGPAGVPEDQSSSPNNEVESKPGLGLEDVNASGAEIVAIRANRAKQLLILMVLALVSLGAGVWATKIFPHRAPITSPSPFRVLTSGSYSYRGIYLNIDSEYRSVKLSVSADAASPTTPGRNDGYVDIVFLGRISVSCPHEVKCSPSPDGDLTEIAVPINIQENGDSIAETVTIHDLRFGAASNGVSAIAQFPTVLLGKNTAGTAPTLDISYSLRDADNYDWSVPPAEYLEGNSYVDWTEQLGGGSVSEVQPMVITGTNEGAQARDDRNTFISGVLLGVAGSAAIAFAQEGLHMLFDNRDDNRPRGSGGGRKANR